MEEKKNKTEMEIKSIEELMKQFEKAKTSKYCKRVVFNEGKEHNKTWD